MKVVIQRAQNAHVSIEDQVVGQIESGLVALVGVTHEDTTKDVDYLVNKIVNLRIFEDESSKMNLSLKDVGGSVLSISQFTLFGDTRKGRRPSFAQAANPQQAEELYDQFNNQITELGIHLEKGRFGEMMDVQLTNVGPVTMIIDSHDK